MYKYYVNINICLTKINNNYTMISSSEFDTDCSQSTECPLTIDEYIEVKDQCALDSQE